jgi:hypothetical protein
MFRAMARVLTSAAICMAFLAVAPAASAQNGTIAGTVTDAVTSAPVASVSVRLNGSTGQVVAQGSTDTSGHYQFGDVAPGTYYLRTTAVPSPYVAQAYAGISCVAVDCGPVTGTPIVVAAGATVTADVALSSGGSFTGTVRRAIDNAPVPSLSLHVYNSSTSFVKTVEVVTGGVYTVTGLPTGSYFARVAFPGSGPIPPQHNYIPEMYGGIQCPHALPQSDCRIASSTPIPVTAGTTTPGIDFLLDVPGAIRGQVTDQVSGLALVNVVLSAYIGATEVANAVSSSDGAYEFIGLPAGAYRVRTRTVPTGYVHEWSNGLCVGCAGTAATIAVGPGATVSAVNFVLGAGGRITGRVDRPCPDLPVGLLGPPALEAYSATGAFVQNATFDPLLTDPPGCVSFTYRIEGLAPGQYYLLVRDYPADPFNPFFASSGDFVDALFGGPDCVAADCDVRRGVPVPVLAGGVTAGIDIQLKRGASFTMAGGGASAGGPSPDYVLYDARGVPQSWVLRRNLFSSPEFVGLPPGTYYVGRPGALFDGIPCADCPPTSGTPIVIEPNSTGGFGVTINDPVGVQVSGTVRDAAGAAPLSTIAIELYSGAGRLIRAASSDVFGRYAFFGVTPGTYFLRTRNDRGYTDMTFANTSCAACDVRLGTPVVVSTVDVTAIDFTLTQGGVVSGAVTDTAGYALGGVAVSLLTPGGAVVEQAITSASGQFRVTVPAGSYRARAEGSAVHGAEIFSEAPCTSAQCDVAAGAAVPVSTAAVTPGINFTVSSCTAMTLTPPSLATGVAGRTYRQVLSTSGGSGAITFAVTSGVLPLGVSLGASTGIIEGTPSASGQHAFTIAALDAAGCATARAYTLDVHSCAFALSPSSATVPAAGGTVAVTISDPCGVQSVTATSFVTVQSNTPGQVVLDVPVNPGATVRSDTITIGRRVFTVLQAAVSSQPPFGVLDTPGDGVQVSGSLGVGGWALDDLGVARVQIFRDPVAGEPQTQIFIGTAVFVRGARPDIRQLYPTYPQNDRGGWGYLLLTNMLPNQGNGIFRIYAYAQDAEGSQTLLGARTIVGINAAATSPFGAIDTPAQGETVAGTAYVNWGWALTPQPKIIPTDGSTVQVLVDGVVIGAATYNLFRADVAGLFPGLANSGGPVGARTIDTTALAEGQHTIAWVVTDSAGAAAGIGSRYFTVANSADAQAIVATNSAQTSSVAPAPAETPPPPATLAVIPGDDLGRRVESLATDRRELRPRRLRPTERLELPLDRASDDERCAGTWDGYLVEGDRLEPLPVGAAIDRTGTFYWQPGPGFAGLFHLQFVRTACDGSKRQVSVAVTLRPQCAYASV